VRVLFNSSILRAPLTGIGHYAAEIASALQRDERFQMHFFDGRKVISKPGDSPATTAQGAALLRHLPGAYQFRRGREQFHFNRAVARLQPQLYHDPSLWPLHFDGPTVMTVHAQSCGTTN